MPIEIRELIVKAEVDNQTSSTENANSVSDDNVSEIVRLCVEKVMKIINESQER